MPAAQLSIRSSLSSSLSWLSLVLAVGLGACKADVDVNGPGYGNQPGSCVPGAVQQCMCASGAVSQQVCNADGASFGTCACGSAGMSGGSGSGSGSAGINGNVGGAGQAGMSSNAAGSGGASGSNAFDAGIDTGMMDVDAGPNPEPGRLAGITAAHNAARAAVTNPVPTTPIPELTWSSSLAQTAQAYADQLATSGCMLVHSGANGLGENLAYYGGQMATPEQVVDGWASESECYTYGKFMQTDACDSSCIAQHFSNGCGHYTQVVWRQTTMLGCGVADCTGSQHKEIWVCNYTMQGNYIGQFAY